jgi:hypothetical protein
MKSNGGRKWNSFAPVFCSRKKKNPAIAHSIASTPIGEVIKTEDSGIARQPGNKAPEYKASGSQAIR